MCSFVPYQDEVIKLCNTVSAGNPMFPGNYVAAMQLFDTYGSAPCWVKRGDVVTCVCYVCRNNDGQLDFEEFAMMNKRFPMLFYPAFRMQIALQSFTLGELA